MFDGIVFNLLVWEQSIKHVQAGVRANGRAACARWGSTNEMGIFSHDSVSTQLQVSPQNDTEFTVHRNR
jgi:hypothetical protein